MSWEGNFLLLKDSLEEQSLVSPWSVFWRRSFTGKHLFLKRLVQPSKGGGTKREGGASKGNPTRRSQAPPHALCAPSSMLLGGAMLALGPELLFCPVAAGRRGGGGVRGEERKWEAEARNFSKSVDQQDKKPLPACAGREECEKHS